MFKHDPNYNSLSNLFVQHYISQNFGKVNFKINICTIYTIEKAFLFHFYSVISDCQNIKLMIE